MRWLRAFAPWRRQTRRGWQSGSLSGGGCRKRTPHHRSALVAPSVGRLGAVPVHQVGRHVVLAAVQQNSDALVLAAEELRTELDTTKGDKPATDIVMRTAADNRLW